MPTTILPPGPKAPVALQTVRWMRRPGVLLTECAERFGDLFTIRLPGIGPVVFLQSPADVRAVFAADPDLLRAGESNVVLKPLLGSYSVLILDGPPHRRQRRLLMPPFHGERMRAYTDVMREAALRSLERWPRNGEAFALHPHMQQITLDVILRAVFGIAGDSPEGRELGGVLAKLLDSIASPVLLLPGLLGFDPFRRVPRLPMSRHKAAADRLVFAEIARRRASSNDRADILSMLLQAHDEEGKGMTDEELRDELMTLLVAGHETTATALAWTFDLLLHTPEALERLRAEVAAENVDLAHAPFLDGVVKESLRLRPVLPMVVRKLAIDWTVHGYTLPKGVRVAPCIWLVHRRPDLYPDPHAFKPERFAGKTPDPSEWLPFGGGNRRCLGAAFAIHEMKIVLGALLPRVRLEATGPAEAVRRRSITFSPRYGTRVRVVPPS